jgi:hypothetical protein
MAMNKTLSIHKFCRFALAIVLAVTTATMHAAEPTATSDQAYLLIVGVLDTSLSMRGEKFDISRREILEKARQIPPSPATRWVLVPFHT